MLFSVALLLLLLCDEDHTVKKSPKINFLGKGERLVETVVTSACSNRSRIIPKVISKLFGIRPKKY